MTFVIQRFEMKNKGEERGKPFSINFKFPDIKLFQAFVKLMIYDFF